MTPSLRCFAALGALLGACSRPDLVPDAVPPPPEPPPPERLPLDEARPVDLLLAIDDSRGMADKSRLLAGSLSDLVRALTHPPCRLPSGDPLPEASQPAPRLPCPTGSARDHAPVVDLHVGIVGSSLGGHGAPGICEGKNGRGRLLDGGAPTHEGKGFLAWDPRRKRHPAGESDAANFDAQLANLVGRVGESGCTYEAPLESVYRFLVDPDPYAELALDESGKVVDAGTDEVLLAQRAAFLRPDSLLAIVVLSDENDCSVREEGFYWLVLAEAGVPRARSACAEDIHHPCCSSCGVDPSQLPPECGPDPSCTEGAELPDGDHPDLRCFDQKRRFGIDFLYPTSRYADAFTSLSVPDRAGNMVANPIFSDLDPSDDVNAIRDESHVFFAAIVGVPWQDIARDPQDPGRGFRSPEEMIAPRPELGGASTWDLVLGGPGEAPLDPLMRASIEPREGTHPLDARFSPTLERDENPVNGHEWDAAAEGALQLACVFPLPEAKSCSGEGCVCHELSTSPLCDPSGPAQVRAGAEPGLRELEVVRALGLQGIAASICPAGAPGSGLMPTMHAIAERLASRLDPFCMARELPDDGNGGVSCVLFEARPAEGACACASPGKRAVAEEHAALAAAIAEDRAGTGPSCVCEIEQLRGAEAASCREDPGAPEGDGFCYVDPAQGFGSEARVSGCDAQERRKLRFAGGGRPAPEAEVFISCSGFE